MKKRSFLSNVMLVLTIVMMVVGVRTTTFAKTNPIKATVEFVNSKDDAAYKYYEIQINPDDFNRQYAIPDNATGLVIKDKPTIMDATLKALGDNLVLGNTKVGWDEREIKKNNVVVGHETVGGFLGTILGLSTETAADSSSTVWRGYAWKYQVNYEDVNVYATNKELKDGMVISWFYNYCEEPIK